ncbi:MAG: hypothetical protein M1495_00445 [Bacteroidetes bacterium]|nr:hypothetical protein [Bacteroidota bacterium]
MRLFIPPKYFFGVLLLTFFAASAVLHAGSLDTLVVKGTQKVRIDSIKISGNNVTKDFIIRRELTISEDDSVTEKIIDYNRERVFSLGLFTNVKMFVYNSNQKNNLMIAVDESWYIYPLLYFRSEHNSINSSTLGLSLLYKNFRGRNETIFATVGIGYQPYYRLAYKNPALLYNEDIGIEVDLMYTNFVNKNVEAATLVGNDFKEKIIDNSVTLSKRFNQFNMVFVTIGFNYVETPYPGLEKITASGRGIDRVPYAGISYNYDSRDLKQFSDNGFYAFGSITHKGFGEDNINYNVFSLDLREYEKIIGGLSAKWRIAYRSTFGGTIPYYNYSYLGYEERVRGNFMHKREGNNYLLASVEVNHPIIKEWDVSLKLPLLPRSLTSARLGLYLGLFYDAGATYNNYQRLSLNQFYSGYGIGFTILAIPYSSFRVEYAINQDQRGEFIFATGFSF